MSDGVKRRAYDSSRRKAGAILRRALILDAARRLFVTNGYIATTMNDIAAEAGAAVDTLYAVAGTKPQIFALLIETALSGTDEAVPVAKRDYIANIRAEPRLQRKIELYAESVALIWVRMAPLLDALQGAAAAEPELASLWDRFLRRRADNMQLFIDELEKAGRLRLGLDRSEAADTAWAISSTEVFLLLTRKRGWSTERYRAWLADGFERLLTESADASLAG